MNMPEESDDDLMLDSISTFDEKGELWRVPLKNQLKRGADPKEREKKLAQREAERRERSEKIFAQERWTREQAVRWIAFRDKHSMERSIRAAVFYDPNSLRDPAANSSFTEAVRNILVTEYRDGRSAWYLSEQVRTVFPLLGLKTINKRQATISAIHQLGVANLDLMSQKEREGKVMDRVRSKYLLDVSERHVRNIWKEEKARSCA